MRGDQREAGGVVVDVLGPAVESVRCSICPRRTADLRKPQEEPVELLGVVGGTGE
jgi:hypothetical protein